MANMTQAGEMNLEKLLREMNPELCSQVYGFISSTKAEALSDQIQQNCIMKFEENEGTTYIIPLEDLKIYKIQYEFACQKITLKIHSNLEAVGFLAQILEKLAEKNIPCNVVSGFYHDHLFVPEGRGHEALEMLTSIV
ncbi:uncharacterized protein LOC111702595 [Eurytemora carolleeae]|uniref:uncharacterized protein LOC111702595 n=1 Tax=Eurytemora carolleeae TaxID=1294199 RepID=UPI000C7787B2|nr:uncharacterized protein LOC111702595 [Eurytemora carolleeae]|eukprot:XP_023330104.1 uncharacterized protein LOC111702595 [Eurytemora affinis]